MEIIGTPILSLTILPLIQIGNYVDKFRTLPVVKKMTQLAGGGAKVKVALGSLATQNQAETLIKEIFRQVEK